LFGGQASMLELEGAFAGMQGVPKPGYKMVGLILIAPQVTITFKFTGPKEKVDQERSNFDSFIASLKIEVTGDGGSTGAPMDSDVVDAPTLKYAMPEGWTALAPSGMRLVNLQVSPLTQCYLIELPGEAGGLLDNLNRWRTEVGLEEFDEVAMATLPAITMFGRDVYLLEVSGDYQGMGGEGAPDQTVLGVCRIDATSSFFVKMVGPSQDVAAHKERFVNFVTSLQQ
jgi:hypothetical protein